MTRKEAVKLVCDCGHVMGAKKADTLNQLISFTRWECSKCKKKYTTIIIIKSSWANKI